MEDQDKDVLSDEVIAEQEKEAVADEAALRTRVVSELGLADDDANKELIDNLVKREGGLRKGFGKLLSNYRTLKTKVPKPTAPVTQPSTSATTETLTAEQIRTQTEASTRAALDEEFLDESDFSDEVKQAIRDEAKRQGVSARKASKSEFVIFKIGKEKEAKRIDEAANNGKRQGARGSAADPSKPLNPADFDLSTAEGRKEWEDAKAARRQK